MFTINMSNQLLFSLCKGCIVYERFESPLNDPVKSFLICFLPQNGFFCNLLPIIFQSMKTSQFYSIFNLKRQFCILKVKRLELLIMIAPICKHFSFGVKGIELDLRLE
jgi:hypothetical protein